MHALLTTLGGSPLTSLPLWGPRLPWHPSFLSRIVFQPYQRTSLPQDTPSSPSATPSATALKILFPLTSKCFTIYFRRDVPWETFLNNPPVKTVSSSLLHSYYGIYSVHFPSTCLSCPPNSELPQQGLSPHFWMPTATKSRDSITWLFLG